MEAQPQANSRTRGNNAPRKFTIQSNFGRAREPRSRKNRPCDVCRKRKTACVITSKPPCLFCKSRGLACQSSTDTADRRNDARAAHQSSPLGDNFEADISFEPSPAADSTPDDSRHVFEDVGTHLGSESAAVVHQGLIHQSVPFEHDFRAVSFGPSPTATDPPDNPIHALEDVEGRTAHAMGLAAEQDTYFLDAFRSLLISERDEVDANIVQVYSGGPKPEDHPIHFLLLLNGFPDHTNRAMQVASDGIEAIVWPHGPALVRLFFKHVHPIFPVVSKGRFLRQYSTGKETIPASLRGAIYGLACVFWDRDPSLTGPCPFQQHEVTNHAHDALRRELEAPNLLKLQACLLLLHVEPPDIDSVETPRTWILAAQTTACAQMIGLHQDPGKWNIAPWEKKLRKKLWWATYMSDCWSSVCHGNPPLVSPGSFDTTPPEMDDLRFDEDVPENLQYLVDPEDTSFRISTGARFLEMVTLARAMRGILDCSFQVNKASVDVLQSRASLLAFREQLQDWPSLIPSCLGIGSTTISMDERHNGPLHLAFHATQVLLHRGLFHPATKEAKATPGSNLRQAFSLGLKEAESFTRFMSFLQKDELEGFWGRHARSQLILCGNFLIYLFLLASQPADIEVAYRLLESFHQSLQSLGTTQHEGARLLLRPIMLRIDSFFIQAAELIKQGRPVESSPIASN